MQSNGQNNFMTPYNSNHIANQQMQIKQEPYNSNLPNSQMQIKQESSNHGLFTGVYPGASDLPNPDFSNWNIPAPNEPLQQISSQLLNFCLTTHPQLNARSQEIRKFLSADNIKHFLEQFSNFQGHFPIIHMPTFRITDTYEGLLLAFCIKNHVNVDAFVAANFDWNAWVEQEKRSRLLYMIFLLDSVLVIFFNIAPSFDALEIRLPLPADDAAWEARTSAECADALGLNGPAVSAQKNSEGNRRRKQPEMHTVLKTLMHHSYDMQTGTTNLFSKFVLVHALHVQLWTAQKQVSQESGQITASLSSGTNTPLSQNDWVVRSGDQNGSGAPSANNSGRATPVDGQSHQLLKSVTTAFEKWKKAWDEDIAVQYPPGSSYPRRFGFLSRRCTLLLASERWASADTSKRGEEPGSISDIDKDFGVANLTLDMAQLFRPVNAKIDSPVQGVHTNI
ncbi:hypothetical protein DID88_002184 [Monilinia fructigena]|uniref:Xylanolytic transcriptional activator regulatory domain-containing protein n=1 Tax=Monilinia fructigena TaxID=38457 RepID=A0A395IVK8_9HELO|nr:hypothetical protein DID88_002184 [Monilinia fructigena]